MTNFFLEVCNDNSECMEGQSCIFTDNPFLGECIYDDTDEDKNLKGKDIVKHPVSVKVSYFNYFLTLKAALYTVTFTTNLVQCSDSTECNEGEFCHISDGESQGQCFTRDTFTNYIQEFIIHSTTTTPKPIPKGT